MMNPDYPLPPQGSQRVRRDWPPYHTPDTKVDRYPYRSKPGTARQLAGGRDPWPMRSKMPDVGWLINSKYPKPGRVQPSPRFEPEYFPEPEAMPEMESIPYGDPVLADEPAPPASRRRDPYRFERPGRSTEARRVFLGF